MGRRKRLPHKASEFGVALARFEMVCTGYEDGADEIGGGPVGVEIIDDEDGAFETIALENGFEIFERIAPGEEVVRVDPQLENETEAAAETARRFHQEHALAGD